MNRKITNAEYESPSLELLRIHPEGSILIMSGGSIGVGDWDDSGEDFGGSAN